jgi:hypothetical protein
VNTEDVNTAVIGSVLDDIDIIEFLDISSVPTNSSNIIPLGLFLCCLFLSSK